MESLLYEHMQDTLDEKRIFPSLRVSMPHHEKVGSQGCIVGTDVFERSGEEKKGGKKVRN